MNNIFNISHLLENHVYVHVHGETAEVKQGLVCGQVLLYDVLPVDGDESHGDEQVEIVSLVVGPARLPHTQGVCLGELTLEAQQDPTARDRVIIIIMTFFAPISSKIKLSGATKPRD